MTGVNVTSFGPRIAPAPVAIGYVVVLTGWNCPEASRYSRCHAAGFWTLPALATSFQNHTADRSTVTGHSQSYCAQCCATKSL